MKKAIISLVILFLPLCLLLVGVNYFVDPTNVFHSVALVEETCEINVSGKNADGIVNFSDRLYVEKRLTEMGAAPSVLIYGSSRSAQIDSAVVGTDCFNASVSGATLEDVASIYEISRKNGLAPKKVILCVEPWYFDINKKDERFGLYLSDYYESFIGRNIDDKYSYSGNRQFDILKDELISLGNFQAGVYSLFDGSAYKQRGPVATDNTVTNIGMIKSDGSFVYPNSYVFSSESDVRLRIEQALEGIVLSLRDCGGIDPNKQAVFEALVKDIISDGSSLTILISPYEPYAFSKIEAEPDAYKNLTEIESYLSRLCDDTGATLVGSFNPSKLGLSSASFIDALHITYDETYALFHDIV